MPPLALRCAMLALALATTACGTKTSTDGGETSTSTDTGASQDPLLNYGPCGDNPQCGRGSLFGIGSIGPDGQTCICVVSCAELPCPSSPDWLIEPICSETGDLSPRCVLPCDPHVACPGESFCSAGECVWASGEG